MATKSECTMEKPSVDLDMEDEAINLAIEELFGATGFPTTSNDFVRCCLGGNPPMWQQFAAYTVKYLASQYRQGNNMLTEKPPLSVTAGSEEKTELAVLDKGNANTDETTPPSPGEDSALAMVYTTVTSLSDDAADAMEKVQINEAAASPSSAATGIDEVASPSNAGDAAMEKGKGERVLKEETGVLASIEEAAPSNMTQKYIHPKQFSGYCIQRLHGYLQMEGITLDNVLQLSSVNCIVDTLQTMSNVYDVAFSWLPYGTKLVATSKFSNPQFAQKILKDDDGKDSLKLFDRVDADSREYIDVVARIAANALVNSGRQENKAMQALLQASCDNIMERYERYCEKLLPILKNFFKFRVMDEKEYTQLCATKGCDIIALREFCGVFSESCNPTCPVLSPTLICEYHLSEIVPSCTDLSLNLRNKICLSKEKSLSLVECCQATIAAVLPTAKNIESLTLPLEAIENTFDDMYSLFMARLENLCTMLCDMPLSHGELGTSYSASVFTKVLNYATDFVLRARQIPSQGAPRSVEICWTGNPTVDFLFDIIRAYSHFAAHTALYFGNFGFIPEEIMPFEQRYATLGRVALSPEEIQASTKYYNGMVGKFLRDFNQALRTFECAGLSGSQFIHAHGKTFDSNAAVVTNVGVMHRVLNEVQSADYLQAYREDPDSSKLTVDNSEIAGWMGLEIGGCSIIKENVSTGRVSPPDRPLRLAVERHLALLMKIFKSKRACGVKILLPETSMLAVLAALEKMAARERAILENMPYFSCLDADSTIESLLLFYKSTREVPFDDFPFFNRSAFFDFLSTVVSWIESFASSLAHGVANVLLPNDNLNTRQHWASPSAIAYVQDISHTIEKQHAEFCRAVRVAQLQFLPDAVDSMDIFGSFGSVTKDMDTRHKSERDSLFASFKQADSSQPAPTCAICVVDMTRVSPTRLSTPLFGDGESGHLPSEIDAWNCALAAAYKLQDYRNVVMKRLQKGDGYTSTNKMSRLISDGLRESTERAEKRLRSVMKLLKGHRQPTERSANPWFFDLLTPHAKGLKTQLKAEFDAQSSLNYVSEHARQLELRPDRIGHPVEHYLFRIVQVYSRYFAMLHFLFPSRAAAKAHFLPENPHMSRTREDCIKHATEVVHYFTEFDNEFRKAEQEAFNRVALALTGHMLNRDVPHDLWLAFE